MLIQKGWFSTLQWRLLAVFLILSACYAIGNFYLQSWHRREAAYALEFKVQQNRQFFDRLVELRGNSLYTFTYDYTFWDDMVSFVEDFDSTWAQENLMESLSTYDADLIWAYDAAFQPVYFGSERGDESLRDPEVLRASYAAVFAKSPFAHFYVATASGLIEIRGATIHPTADDLRVTAPRGYFFAGRIWDKDYLSELGELINGSVSVVMHPVNDQRADTSHVNGGTISWQVPMQDWQGHTVAQLSVQTFSPEIDREARTANMLIVFSVMLTLTLLGLIIWVLTNWVALPLRRISSSLAREDITPIRYLSEDRTELGNIMHLIERFLEQKLDLVREIEQRKQAERAREALESQLRRAQRLETIGTLAGGVAHDFNNILTPIMGYADMTLAQLDERSPMRGDVEQIVKAANRARDLVRQILAFSRQAEQERKPIEPRFVFEEALNLLRASVPATIEIRSNLRQECGTVMCDPSQIHQVFMNLCTNAFQAMDENGGVLDVSLDCVEVDAEFSCLHLNLSVGPYMRLIVSDTGCGMDRATAERIFEPFFTTKPAGKGTGLGLSVAHGIITAHGGGITVYSEPGLGTTFHVYLPTIKNDVASRFTAPAETHAGTEHVLFVDDEEAIVRMGRDMLERMGYDVTARNVSGEALELFRADPDSFDVVVTDQTMPQMTGDRLAQELLKIRPDIPIVMITGFSNRITDENYQRYGIREFVMKPLIARDLHHAIRRAVKHEVVVTV